MGGCLPKEQLDFEGPVDFRHFEILRAIGKGAFGKVCIVKKKDNKEMYAMKYMNKVQIIEKRAVDNVFREIHILKSLSHPFIVNLWFAFQDEEDIFLVLDLMLGGDLSYHLEKEGRFSVPRVQLYMAELCMALDYLAVQKIVHRDLKPANMLLDSKGHIHLTDFNVASIQRPGKIILSMTGTKPYMAPEVVKPPRRGYSTAVDWWSLGVSAYEMLRGERPYLIHHNMSNDEMHRILTQVRPPASARWTEATCNVLKLLLHPDPNQRLATLEKAKAHPFFEDINWDGVYALDTKPQYVPSQNRIHCDPTHELEEMIVEPNPLHKKKSRLSKRRHNEVGEVGDDLAKIDGRFQVYNRITDSIHRTISQEDDTTHSFSESASAGTFTSSDGALKDTTLSLRKESIDSNSHNNVLAVEGNNSSTVAVVSPIQVVVQDYETEEKKDNQASGPVSTAQSSSPQTPSPNTTESSPIETETAEPKVEDKVTEDQSVGSSAANDQDVVSEAALSTGTPSTAYNPKDSDSIVPMHLLGSYSESVEGDFVVMDVAPPISDKEPSLGEGSNKDGIEDISPNMEGISEEPTEINHSKQIHNGGSNSDDSDTQTLV